MALLLRRRRAKAQSLCSRVMNPAVMNPAVMNPAVMNPAVMNPAVMNPAVMNWTVASLGRSSSRQWSVRHRRD